MPAPTPRALGLAICLLLAGPTPSQAQASPRAESTPTAARHQAPEAAWLQGRSPQEAQGLKAIQAWIQQEAGQPLQHRSTSFLLPTAQRPAKGIVLLLHGFSAAPWQCEPMAQALAQAGYHAFAPRLPGHGRLDARGKEDPSQLPQAADWARYLAFAKEQQGLLAQTGLPRHALGLSVGAALALAIAEEDPGLGRVVALAPFMAAIRGDWLLNGAAALDGPTGGLTGWALGAVPWGWGPEAEAQTAEGSRPGHAIFPLGCVAAVDRLGHRVQAQAPQWAGARLQLVTTGADDTVPLKAQAQLVAALPPGALAGWHHYPKAEGVPHPMLHPFEAKGSGHVPALQALCLRFIQDGLPSQRPPQAGQE